MPSEVAIGVFARAPVAGRTKTRLAAVIGPERAARLYEAFLADTLARHADATVFFASPDDEAYFARRHPDRRRAPQREGGLGVRMEAALAALLERASTAIVLGSDAPTLPAGRVASAAAALGRDADVVLGPAADGGYYLIGSRGRVPALGGSVRWSTRHALADTLTLLRAAGQRPALLAPWYDVDTVEDLRLLRAHLGVRPAAAPVTAQALFDPDGGA